MKFPNTMETIGYSALKSIEDSLNLLQLVVKHSRSEAKESDNADVAIAFERTECIYDSLARLHDDLDEIIWGLKKLNSERHANFSPRYYTFDDGTPDSIRQVSEEEWEALALDGNGSEVQDPLTV